MASSSVERVAEQTVFTDGLGDEFSDALVDLVRQVDPTVVARVARVPVAEVRELLATGSPGAVRAMFEDASAAWTSVVADPGLVTLSERLIGEVGLRSEAARRAVVARRIVETMGRTPMVAGSSGGIGAGARTTSQGAHYLAQSFAGRFNADFVQRDAVVRAGKVVDDLVKDLERQTSEFVSRMEAAFAGAKTAAERKAVLRAIEGRKGLVADMLAGVRESTDRFADRLAADLDAAAVSAFRDGTQRALDRMWDLHDLPGNALGAEKANLSRRRWRSTKLNLERSFFRTTPEAIRFAVTNNPVLAGRVSRQVRDGIAETIARTSILRGENSRFVGRQIAAEYGRALEGIGLSARKRAVMIARTETARIQADADQAAMTRMGVREVEVFYSGGAFPCDICPDIAQGGPYEIAPQPKVPLGGIPFHPNCRCSYGPVVPPEGTLSPLWNQGENRAADGVVVANLNGQDHVLMIERQDGSLALPGGFVDGNREGVAAARRTARREIVEETGLSLKGVRAGNVGYFRDPGRDPRARDDRWVSSRGFLFDLGRVQKLPEVAGLDDARAAKWVPMSRALAQRSFADHGTILRTANSIREQRGIASIIRAAADPVSPTADRIAEIAARRADLLARVGQLSRANRSAPHSLTGVNRTAKVIKTDATREAVGLAEEAWSLRVQQLELASVAERREMTRQMAEGMVKKGVASRDRIVTDLSDSLATMPPDIAARLEASGLLVEQGNDFRGTWVVRSDLVRAGKGGSRRLTTMDHELVHAVDSILSDSTGSLSSRRYVTNGKAWADKATAWAGKRRGGQIREAGEELQSIFEDVVGTAGRRTGVYKNGDGKYFIANWVNSYEGRIYDTFDGDVGIEFITMNSQRYLAHKRITERTFEELIARGVERESARAAASGITRRGLVGDQISLITSQTGLDASKAKDVLSSLDVPFEQFNEARDWWRARKTYGTRLDDPMEKLWGKPRF